MAAYTFALKNLAINESLLFKAALERVALRTGIALKPVAADTADFVFYRGAEPKAASASMLIRVAKADEAATGAHLKFPPTINDLIGVLKRVTARKAQPTELAQAGALASAMRLRRMMSSGKRPAKWITPSGEGWIISPNDKQFFSVCGLARRASDITRLVCANELEWQEATAAEFAAGTDKQGIEVLFWHLGTLAGQEGLVPWIKDHTPLRLRGWPYLINRAPRSYLALSGRLRLQTLTPANLLEDGTGRADVYGFINALALCGYLSVEPAAMPASTGSAAPAQATSVRTEAAAPRTQPATVTRRSGMAKMLGAIRGALGIPQ